MGDLDGYGMCLSAYEYFKPVFELDENREWIAMRVQRKKSGPETKEELECGFFVALNFGLFVQFYQWKENQRRTNER